MLIADTIPVRLFHTQYFFDLSSGTIQGSGIGPLLFITYINELADLLSDYNVIVKLFADDLKLYAEISTDIETTHFNGALQCINDWANAW